MELDFSKRYQTMLILWFALLLSVAIYFVIAKVVGSTREIAPNQLPIVVINGVGAVLVLTSFAVKRKLLERSVEKQDPFLVQKAMIVALAMCESCALLGLLQRFAFGNREYFLLFIVAAVGVLFHFPRRSQLEAASHTNTKLWN